MQISTFLGFIAKCRSPGPFYLLALSLNHSSSCVLSPACARSSRQDHTPSYTFLPFTEARSKHTHTMITV